MINISSPAVGKYSSSSEKKKKSFLFTFDLNFIQNVVPDPHGQVNRLYTFDSFIPFVVDRQMPLQRFIIEVI